MQGRTLVAAIALLAATQAHAVERTPAPAGVEHDATSRAGWVDTGDVTPGMVIGEQAPEFSYLGTDGAWHGWSELVASGPVLLVFGARDRQLRDLDGAREEFKTLGIHTVAVLDMRTGSAARLMRRLGVTETAIADPKCAIAELYDSLDPLTRQHSRACFVIDARGCLRGAVRGNIPDAHDLADFAARSLNHARPEVSISG